MREEILEVTESLARKVLHLGVNFSSTKFSVTDKAVDITMSNGIVVAKITLPRHLIEDTIEFLSGREEGEVEAEYNKLLSRRHPDEEEEESKPVKRVLRRIGG